MRNRNPMNLYVGVSMKIQQLPVETEDFHRLRQSYIDALPKLAEMDFCELEKRVLNND
tara:strand:+ start:155 stop:328 length:174 start_codon:yes stop_codon:yes gene_type:complete